MLILSRGLARPFLLFVSGVENLQHFEAYQQALKEGEKVALTYVKLILFGPPMSGKTSTRKRLLNEIVNLQVIGDKTVSTGVAESTEVILKREKCNEESSDVLNKRMTSTSAAVFKEDGGKWQWETVKSSKPSEPSEHEQNQDKWEGDLRYIAKIFFTIITNNSKDMLKQKQAQPTPNPTNSTEFSLKQIADSSSDVTDPTDKTSEDDMNTSATSLPELEAVEKALKSLESTFINHNNAEFQRLIENLIMINMIDVGGQPAFLEMLPTLTIGSALYLLFFRMDHDLQKLQMATFRADESDEAVTLDTEYSIEDVLCQGLSSIASFGCTQPSDTSLQNAKPADCQKHVSHALLVGTYKDAATDIKHCISDVHNLWKKLEKIKEELLLPAGERDDEKFFQVDNMTGHDKLVYMRQKISKYLSKKYTGWDVPATWLIFRIVLQLMDKPVMTIHECEIVANKLNMCVSMKEALWFLHHVIGCLMYFPKIPSLKNVVICNPQAVFDMISKVIIERFNCEDMERKFVKCFKERGEFSITQIHDCSSQENTKYCLTPKQLVDLMTYHRVIAEIGPERYIMPSVLKCASKEDIEKSLTKGSVYPLKIKFSCNYVPIGVFCGAASLLIARLEENGWSLPEDYKLYKNKISFSVGDAYHIDFVAQPLYLGLQVTLQECATRDRMSLIKVCNSVKNKVDRALEDFISQMKCKDPALKSASDNLFFEPTFNCKCGNSSHLMSCIPGKRKGKCTSGILYDLEYEHLTWFGEVSYWYLI